MPRSSTSTGPQTTQSVTQVDKRVGIEGTGNVVLGDGAGLSYSSKDVAVKQKLSGEHVFAPVFNFTGTGIARTVKLSAPVALTPNLIRKY